MNQNDDEEDILDPAYSFFENIMKRRAKYFASMRHLEELSKQLTKEVDLERERKESADPPMGTTGG